jgi:hypothetical protein
MSTSYADLIHTFIEAIGDRDPQRRRASLSRIFTTDCAYTDPQVAVEGIEEIDDVFAALQRATPPESRFALARPVDVHHNQARFFWRLQDGNASTVLATGSDVALFQDGRIHRIYGFFDEAAPEPA